MRFLKLLSHAWTPSLSAATPTGYRLRSTGVTALKVCGYYMCKWATAVVFIVLSYRLISHIIEFNSQLDTLISLLVMVPPLVFNGVRLQRRDRAGRAREERRNQHREEMEKSSREKVRELLLRHQTTVTVALSLPPVVA